MSTSFYVHAEGDRYVAQEATEGPWGAKLQHGGPVAALLASRIEQASGGAGGSSRVSQLALEFLSPVPVATLHVTTEVIRPGKKIAFWHAKASVDGKDVARMSAWVLSAKEGRSPLIRLEDEPPGALPNHAATSYFTSAPKFPYGDAIEWRFAEGHWNQLGPATVWAKLRVGLVDGEELSPLARLLAMVDSANGVGAELDLGKYLFVPVNLSVTLARHPVGAWTGMSATTSIATDGIGICSAKVFDPRGQLGEALQSLFVEPRAR